MQSPFLPPLLSADVLGYKSCSWTRGQQTALKDNMKCNTILQMAHTTGRDPIENKSPFAAQISFRLRNAQHFRPAENSLAEGVEWAGENILREVCALQLASHARLRGTIAAFRTAFYGCLEFWCISCGCAGSLREYLQCTSQTFMTIIAMVLWRP